MSIVSVPSKIILGASAAGSTSCSANSKEGILLMVMFCVTIALFSRISLISACSYAKVEEIKPSSSEVTTPSRAAVIDANSDWAAIRPASIPAAFSPNIVRELMIPSTVDDSAST